MDEKDSFRLWFLKQVDRDAAVFWGALVLFAIAWAIEGRF